MWVETKTEGGISSGEDGWTKLGPVQRVNKGEMTWGQKFRPCRANIRDLLFPALDANPIVWRVNLQKTFIHSGQLAEQTLFIALVRARASTRKREENVKLYFPLRVTMMPALR